MKRAWGPVSAMAVAVALLVNGCGGAADLGSATGTDGAAPQVAAGAGPLNGRPIAANVLLWRSGRLSAALLKKVRKVNGVRVTEQFSLARVFSQGQPVVVAAVDPASFRRFTRGPTARAQQVWDRVAAGEMALRSDLRNQLPMDGDLVPLGNGSSVVAHVSAYADLVRGADIGAVGNKAWAPRLGMPTDNALLISIAPGARASAGHQLKRLVGHGGGIESLDDAGTGPQMALLAGGSVARAVGSFSYTINSDGSVNPDPRWVNGYIRTAQVPLLGDVRCNKAMLPQLRAALAEVVASGLSASIHRSEYGGCYVPRFIGSDRTRGLSMHTWGLAVDLNVAGNQRGTIGTIDPGIVRIFARWGFAWGGTWRDPDPMHFELARLMSVAH